MNWVEILGYTAGVLSAITFLPQVIKTWKMKKAGELSLLTILFVISSVVLWIIYGLIINNKVIIFTNSIILLLSLFILYFKINYKE